MFFFPTDSKKRNYIKHKGHLSLLDFLPSTLSTKLWTSEPAWALFAGALSGVRACGPSTRDLSAWGSLVGWGSAFRLFQGGSPLQRTTWVDVGQLNNLAWRFRHGHTIALNCRVAYRGI